MTARRIDPLGELVDAALVAGATAAAAGAAIAAVRWPVVVAGLALGAVAGAVVAVARWRRGVAEATEAAFQRLDEDMPDDIETAQQRLAEDMRTETGMDYAHLGGPITGQQQAVDR